MVGLVLRFWPEYVELAAARRGRASSDGPLAVSTQRLSPPADWADWLGDRAQSGGTAVDLLIHDFDQMNRLLGTPRRVDAREPEPGHVHALVEYDGAAGLAEGSMRMPRSYPFSSDVRVLCEQGAAEYAFTAAPVEGEGNIGASSSPRGLRVYPTNGDDARRAGRERGSVGAGDRLLRLLPRAGPAAGRGHGEQARQALLVSLAANRSIASGRPEPV